MNLKFVAGFLCLVLVSGLPVPYHNPQGRILGLGGGLGSGGLGTGGTGLLDINPFLWMLLLMNGQGGGGCGTGTPACGGGGGLMSLLPFSSAPVPAG